MGTGGCEAEAANRRNRTRAQPIFGNPQIAILPARLVVSVRTVEGTSNYVNAQTRRRQPALGLPQCLLALAVNSGSQ